MLNRILALLKENGITAKKLTSDLEISNSSVSDWKKGSKPSCDVVVKLAKYFGVSTDYILLGEKSISISQEDQDILKLFHQLPHDAQLEFRGELKGYIKCLKRQEEDTVEPLLSLYSQHPIMALISIKNTFLEMLPNYPMQFPSR